RAVGRERGEQPRVPAHVAVPGRRVDADVVRHAELLQVLLEPAALRREEAIAPAEAGDHRADAAELLGGLRDVAVEDGRGPGRRAPPGGSASAARIGRPLADGKVRSVVVAKPPTRARA